MRLKVLCACLLTTACFGGEGDEAEEVGTPLAPAPAAAPAPTGTPPPAEPPVVAPAPTPTPTPGGKAKPTPPEAVRFLMQSSFGPTPQDVAAVEARGFEGWIADQIGLPMASYEARLDAQANPHRNEVQDLFWGNVMEADDQLRHRVAYALSKIVTVSLKGDVFHNHPQTFGVYMDLLQDQAFGNYQDLIREVSLTPAMGVYLSHLGNRRADAETGIEPDENYAREVMQLFTIGLVELNPDGTQKGGAEEASETYDTDDVRGLAAVFTGLSWADTDFEYPRIRSWNRALPMESFARFHESAPSVVLGRTVDTGTDAVAGMGAGLDVVLAHPNLAPFVTKQLIQHLVTSNPTPAYVARVGAAFEAGRFEGPEGTVFGRGRRGDMAATVAAILLDPEARDAEAAARTGHGKLREPALRFAHLARAFRDDGGMPAGGAMVSTGALRYADDLRTLGQAAYAPPSVFGSFRPGYVVPGGWTANEGMVAPEMQLSTGSGLAGFIEFTSNTVRNKVWGTRFFDLDREPLFAMADDADALLDRIDLMLTGASLTPQTRQRIADALALAVVDERNNEKDRQYRTELALLMVATSPEFAVQR